MIFTSVYTLRLLVQISLDVFNKSFLEKEDQKKIKRNSQNQTQHTVFVSFKEAQRTTLDQCINSAYVFKSTHKVYTCVKGTRAPTLTHVDKTRHELIGLHF